MFSLKILLTEKEESEDLGEQYEASMSNATSWFALELWR